MKHTFEHLLRRTALALALIGAVNAPAAFASTTVGTVAASATLSAACSLQVSPMAFGTVSGIASSASTQTSLSITCTNGTPYTISMNGGISQGAPTNQIAWRYMLSTILINGSKYAMPYQIFQDSANTQQWGNTVGTNTVTGTGTGVAQTLPVYGKITEVAGIPVASYSDTITVSVSY